MVRAFRSGGSFQGNTVISALGASEAMSMATWSGCATMSSGSASGTGTAERRITLR
jgi:hypothetical protein